MSPLALNKDSFAKVLTVVDASIASSSSVFAVHALSSSSTLFLSGSDVISYLITLETDDIRFQVFEAEELAGAPIDTAAQLSKAPVKEKEDAKIEGAVQIAIGVKKEVDFPAWYTNVIWVRTSSKRLTDIQDQVLLKADMLDYYSVSGCYILKPWSYSIWEQIQGGCRIFPFFPY